MHFLIDVWHRRRDRHSTGSGVPWGIRALGADGFEAATPGAYLPGSCLGSGVSVKNVRIKLGILLDAFGHERYPNRTKMGGGGLGRGKIS